MKPPATPSFQGVDHIHVFVADRAAAEHWYERVLGFTRTQAYASWATDDGPLTVVEDHALSMSLYFTDPDGNPYEITTYEHRAAKDRLAVDKS